MSDAAFREALDAYISLVQWLRAWALNRDNTRPSEEEINAARARVLALYAGRQGEVYEVAFIQPDCGDPTVPEHAEEWGVGLHGTMPGWLHPGDRVRVTKVEEARSDCPLVGCTIIGPHDHNPTGPWQAKEAK